MKSKKIALSLVFLLISISFLPLINATSEQSFANSINQKTQIIDEIQCSVKLIEYGSNFIREESKDVSINQALDIIQNLKKEKIQSEQIFSSINSKVVSENTINRNPRLFSQYQNENILGTISIADMMCHVKGKLFGLGAVMGTHSVPIVSLLPGVDIASLFVGFGTIDVTDGIFDDTHHSGLCIGGMIGFAGKILLVILPMIAGPFVYIDGYALATFWI